MQYGDPPSGSYGGQDPQYGGQYPQYGGQYPQQGGQYPQQGGQYPQQGGQYPQQGGQYPGYGADPYQQPPASPYGDPYQGGANPQWGGQQPPPYTPPPSGGGNALPIIAAVVVAVLVLSGVGVWLVMRNGDSDATAGSDTSTSRSARSTTSEESTSSSTTRTTTTRPSASTPGDPAAESDLIAALPVGFSSSNCTPVDPGGDALAKLECSQNTEPGGPATGVFTMYSDVSSLDRAFNSSDPVAKTEQLQDCPDGVASPSSWTYTAEPDVTAGYVACGASADNTPQVTWSKYNDLTMGYVTGPDLQALHDWWWEFG